MFLDGRKKRMMIFSGGQTRAKKSAEKSKPKGKMKKRKSDASHEKREEEEEGEEEEELRLPPLPSTRLSKEALIDKFKNFEDMKVRPPSSSRDDDDDIERGELKMDFNKVPEILKDFDRGGKNGGDADDGFVGFSSDSDDKNEVLEKKSKGKEEEKEEDGNDDDDKDISFEEKLLSNAADDRSGKLRMRADIALNEGEYAGKSTSRAKMFADEEEELRKNNPHYDEDVDLDDFEGDDYPDEEEDFENKSIGSAEEEEYSDDESEEEEEKNKNKKEGSTRRNEYDNFSDDDDDDDDDDDGGWNIHDEGDEEMRAVLDSATRKKGKRRKSDKEAAKMFKKFEAELPRLNISDDEDEDEEDEDDDDDADAMDEDDDEEEDELGGEGGGAKDNREEDEEDDDDDDDFEDDDDDFDYAGAMEKDDVKRKPSSTKRASARDEEEEEEDDEDDDDEIEDAADPRLEEELKKFELEEQETKRLAEQKAKTEQKSKSVRIQRALWEQMLRMRIKLQKGIENGMKMPGPLANQGLRRLSESANKSLDSLATTAKDTLLSMLHLQVYLMKQFEKTGEVDTTEVAAKLKNLKQKREEEKSDGGVSGPLTSTEQFWNVCEAMQNEFAEFRDSSCDRWQRKSQVSSGNAGNLKAFNQNISQQVRAAMLAPEKAIDRSRPVLTRTKKIGENVQVSRLGDTTNSDDSDDEHFDRDEDGARPNKNGSSMESRKDIESYDDFDMYEQLLKEFLESGNVDGDAPRSAAKPAKRRKIVDRRASKGRKLRYHVQEPLVNFVSSIEEEVPQWADKLFTQLFASKG